MCVNMTFAENLRLNSQIYLDLKRAVKTHFSSILLSHTQIFKERLAIRPEISVRSSKRTRGYFTANTHF